MSFGTPSTLRELASALRGDVGATRHAAGVTQSRMAGAVASAGARERPSWVALASRWGHAHGIVQNAADACESTASQLDELADALERCESTWNARHGEALSHGFAVRGHGEDVAVVPGPDGSPEQQRRAREIEQELRGSAQRAESARLALRSHLNGTSVPGLATLEAGRGPVRACDTGDGSLDGDLQRVLAPLTGVRRLVSRTE